MEEDNNYFVNNTDNEIVNPLANIDNISTNSNSNSNSNDFETILINESASERSINNSTSTDNEKKSLRKRLSRYICCKRKNKDKTEIRKTNGLPLIISDEDLSTIC